jgi:hypothetical protein
LVIQNILRLAFFFVALGLKAEVHFYSSSDWDVHLGYESPWAAAARAERADSDGSWGLPLAANPASSEKQCRK